MSILDHLRLNIGDVNPSGTASNLNNTLTDVRVDIGDFEAVPTTVSGTIVYQNASAPTVSGLDTLLDIRTDIGDDNVIVVSSGITQTAGLPSARTVDDLRTDIADDFGVVSDVRYIFAPTGVVDNSIVRFDGNTGQYVQDSSVTINDAGDVIIAGNLSVLGVFNPFNFRLITLPGGVVATTGDNILFVRKTISELTTISLSSGFSSGHIMVIKDYKGDASSFPITITSVDGIDGNSFIRLAMNYQSVSLIYSGIGWGIV